MTGWGQEGPLAKAAGHDQNYIALTGALHAMGRKGDKPLPPLNLVGDFGGGGLWLAFGMVAAIYEAEKSGKGQVIDAAMIDGAASLFSSFYGMLQGGAWIDERGVNLLDTGAHFYEVYETKDGKYVSIGSIEPQFYQLLLEATGLDKEADSFPAQFDPAGWPEMKEKLTAVFKTKTRDEWVEIMEGTDICFAPVLSIAEAPAHPHHQARGTFVDVAGVTQPMPGPRFSRTGLEAPRPAVAPGSHTDDVLKAAGYDADGIAALRKSEIVA
jgi:alpha-methylacyl-CoA racemase